LEEIIMVALKIPEFYPKSPGKLDIAVRLSEGTMTVAESNTAFGKELTYSFAAECAKDGLVIAAGVTSDGELLVAPRGESDAQPIGRIITEPKFTSKRKAAGTYTAGNYEYRQATVRFFARCLITADVYLAQSDNLAANDFLKACSVDTYENYFMESTTQTSRLALKAVTASGTGASTSKIPILEGFEVGTSDLI